MPLPLFLFILLVSTLQAEPEERTEEFQALLAEAAMGSPAAQIRVGMAFDGGHGVEKDVVKALHWYRQAAAQGDYRGMLQGLQV